MRNDGPQACHNAHHCNKPRNRDAEKRFEFEKLGDSRAILTLVANYQSRASVRPRQR